MRTDLKEDWQVKEFLIKDNLLRRHLNDYQMVRCGLELEPIEAKKAEKRKEATQLVGKNTEGVPMFKSSVKENFPQPKNDYEKAKVGMELTTTEKKKGQTRDIVAKEVGFGSGRQYEKAKKVYTEAPEPIKKQWQEGKLSTHAAYQRI